MAGFVPGVGEFEERCSVRQSQRPPGLPQEPDVAIGATACGDIYIMNGDIVKKFEVTDAYINLVAAV